MKLLYCITVFMSAVLLFWLQPLFSKTILPLLGGSPSVWNTCMLFYQTMLLAGYAYAHSSIRWLGVKKQAILHIVLLVIAWLSLPLPVISDFSTPNLNAPITWLLLQMSITIGLPLFVLSANAPLIQAWFANTDNQDHADPYFLYSASNTGTLLVLLAFPFFIEPWFSIPAQNTLWNYLFLLFFIFAGCCVVCLLRSHSTGKQTDRTTMNDEVSEPPQLADCVGWMGWAFLPSALLLALTQYITTDVASVPFFWVFPLAMYMLTFAIVFARKPIISHRLIQRIQPFILIPPLVTIIAGTSMFFWIDLIAHLPAFFVHCLFCHGELARNRPHPSHLTTYYFCLALGGALGSIFVSIIAPNLFLTVMEYPLLLTLMIYVCWRQNPIAQQIKPAGTVALLLGLLLLSVCLASGIISFVSTSGVLLLVLVSTLIGPAVFRNMKQPLPVRIIFLLMIAAGILLTTPQRPVLYRSRDFFGAYKVIQYDKWDQHILYVGTTIHGAQFRAENMRHYPVGYFDPHGAVGEYFSVFNNAYPDAHIAVCGLGVGTLAAYGQENQTMTFYEINPKVYDIAAKSGYFTYLTDSAAEITTLFGDARILIQSAEDQSFELIVLDAFNSDSVPVHLLTMEAFELYQQKLKPGGWIAVQISNRYLDLKPVLASIVQKNGWTALVHDEHLDADMARNNRMAAEWILIFQDDSWIETFTDFGVWKILPTDDSIQPWTDHYSNIFSLLKSPDHQSRLK